MQVLFAIVCVLLVVSVAASVMLWRRCSLLVRDQQESQKLNDSLRQELGELRTHIEVTRETQRNAENTFKALAGDVLKHSQEQFLQLAEQRLKAEQAAGAEQIEARRKAVEQLVSPIKETLEKYNLSLQAIEKARAGAYESLMKDLELFRTDQRRLREETGNLVKALRRPEVRGRWGEMQLRRVVEMAGMAEHCDYQEQATLSSPDGRLRPDLIVRLPSHRCIAVDAKTPIDAFIDSLECQDETVRRQCLERHADQIEAKVRELAAKGYQEHLERSPDFTILFIPGESFLQPAVELRPALLESAMERGVVVATPTTLVALLRAVAMGWREERLAENAEKISAQGRLLHERLCAFAGHLDRLRQSLARAVEHYDKAVGSLDRMIVPAVRKLEDLHARSSSEWSEDLTEIAIKPREIKTLPLSVGETPDEP
jgi:DNA recombination protein RmuC